MCNVMIQDEPRSLHVLFFPFLAPGHFRPMATLADRFSSLGVTATIVTTSGNAAAVSASLQPSSEVSVHLLTFPSPASTGLPVNAECLSNFPDFESQGRFFGAMPSLSVPFGALLEDLRPDALIVDPLLPWAYFLAENAGIRTLIFYTNSCLSLCARNSLPNTLPEDDEALVTLAGLPDCIQMRRKQIPRFTELPESMQDMLKEMSEADKKCSDFVMNSFYELEPEYVHHYRAVLGRRAWCVGPISSNNVDKINNIHSAECMEWLDNTQDGSVVYICFGSLGTLAPVQLREIALGLEECGHPFLWVVKEGAGEWLPAGFNERVGDRGLVIVGWAPQLAILQHRAIGGFVTHCGWNSCLEGISAGVPMVTWPLFAEQFFNEKLLVDILRIGISVGEHKLELWPEKRQVVHSVMIKKAIGLLMNDGEEVKERRTRAKELAEKARTVGEPGGSSYVELESSISELKKTRGRQVVPSK